MEKLIHVKLAEVTLEGMLRIPQDSIGIVLFAHGSGSSRFSPRNNFVAEVLHKARLATLLIDLLSPQEDEDYQTRFDIDLLTERLSEVTQWLKKNRETKSLPIGLFGSSTGAAAALRVAAILKEEIKTVVSRGGRPDLAMEALGKVIAPTLLIVGGDDSVVLDLNKEAYETLICKKRIDIIPHATHLFEEPGCLEEVARISKEWFKKNLEVQKSWQQ